MLGVGGRGAAQAEGEEKKRLDIDLYVHSEIGRCGT